MFCLPLDFSSQVMLTGVFVMSTLPGSLCEVHRVLSARIAALPRLIWLHQQLCLIVKTSLSLLGGAILQGSLAGPPAHWPTSGLTRGLTGDGGATAAGAAGAGAPLQEALGEGSADGGGSGSGSGAGPILAAVVSCCFVLYVCGLLPLWIAYHLERVHKQRWLRTQPNLLWLNPPSHGKAGRWPSTVEAAGQLLALLVMAFMASELCVGVWDWLDMPVWR